MPKTDLWTALLITACIFIPLMIIMGIIAALLLRSLHYENDKNFAPGEDFWNGLRDPKDEVSEPIIYFPFILSKTKWAVKSHRIIERALPGRRCEEGTPKTNEYTSKG